MIADIIVIVLAYGSVATPWVWVMIEDWRNDHGKQDTRGEIMKYKAVVGLTTIAESTSLR